MTRRRRLQLPYLGGSLTIDERDHVQAQIFGAGEYEPEVWTALSSHLRTGDVLWDVGAHIGAVSARALIDARARCVVAVEANPNICDILADNLARNGNSYVLVTYALSDRSERIPLYLGPTSNLGLSSVKRSRDAEGKAVMVECTTIDELIKAGVPAPTIMKVDVEGTELAVLTGAQSVLGEPALRTIVFEGRAADGCGGPVVELLGRFGFEVEHLERQSGLIEANENYLATRIPRAVSDSR